MRLTSRGWPRRLRGQEGSLPLSLLATIVVAGLVTVVFTTTLTSHRAADFDHDFTETLHGADAGVQQARFAIEAGSLPLSVGQTSSPATATDAAGTTYEWTVTRLSQREWEVRSTGARDGVERTVVATVVERPQFFPGAFGDQLIALNGTSTHVDSYESATATCPSPADPDLCWGTDPVYGTDRGALGTNEDLTFSGNVTVNRAILYDWRDNPGQSPTADNPGGDRCSGNPCTPDVLRIEQDPLDYGSDARMQFIFDKLARCASDTSHELPATVYGNRNASTSNPTELAPWSTAASDNQGAPYQPGHDSFWCADSLEFLGDTTLSAGATTDTPVVVFVRNFVKLAEPGVRVHCQGCTSSPTGDNSQRPRAGELQIYVASENPSGGSDVFLKAQSKLAGVLYAPRARCGSSGNAGGHVFGSLICKTMDNVGNWAFHFDTALNRFGTDLYDVTVWREEH